MLPASLRVDNFRQHLAIAVSEEPFRVPACHKQKAEVFCMHNLFWAGLCVLIVWGWGLPELSHVPGYPFELSGLNSIYWVKLEQKK